jgi:hypothetical protein
MLFRAESQRFFDLVSPRAARGAAGAAGAARPGLGSLFRPRPPADRRPPANGKAPSSGKASPATPLRSSAESRAAGRLAKAKSRNDAEAVARGATMARNRAKASKSRRTDI